MKFDADDLLQMLLPVLAALGSLISGFVADAVLAQRGWRGRGGRFVVTPWAAGGSGFSADNVVDRRERMSCFLSELRFRKMIETPEGFRELYPQRLRPPRRGLEKRGVGMKRSALRSARRLRASRENLHMVATYRVGE
jgi:hypothetical protein